MHRLQRNINFGPLRFFLLVAEAKTVTGKEIIEEIALSRLASWLINLLSRGKGHEGPADKFAFALTEIAL